MHGAGQLFTRSALLVAVSCTRARASPYKLTMGLWPLRCFGGQNRDKTELSPEERVLDGMGGWDDRVIGEHMFNSGIQPVDTREQCGAERFLPYLVCQARTNALPSLLPSTGDCISFSRLCDPAACVIRYSPSICMAN